MVTSANSIFFTSGAKACFAASSSNAFRDCQSLAISCTYGPKRLVDVVKPLSSANTAANLPFDLAANYLKLDRHQQLCGVAFEVFLEVVDGQLASLGFVALVTPFGSKCLKFMY